MIMSSTNNGYFSSSLPKQITLSLFLVLLHWLEVLVQCEIEVLKINTLALLPILGVIE
jgi:hypothetical protein